jgi:UDP-N-acetylmuramate: L-alanyl-gamma-D-glutamyl-meso-diaminopimelate ligase
MQYHFIAIGGSAMHNLAIALHCKGHQISGSDDEIFEPSRSRLAKHNLLPESTGWFPEKINSSLDAVVLGMHAKKDNPELARAHKLNIPIYSYPEFLFNQTQNKTRAVIGGSHGKTTTTAMVMHVLKFHKLLFDYMVGAQLNGFENMVDFSDNSKIAVFEGDEYLTSPIDPRPKFHLYKPKFALLTGIAWDHINVFPTFENYKSQFETFINQIEDEGTLVYFEGDAHLNDLVDKCKKNIHFIPYDTHPHRIVNGNTLLITEQGEINLQIFGQHNLQNLSGALIICKLLGIPKEKFYQAIQSFEGAAKRLQILAQNSQLTVFQDFAHSPSKLQATIDAVKNQFPHKNLVACMELHTYSSLKKEFLIQYKNTLSKADKAMVFYSKHAIQLKKLEPINDEIIYESFDFKDLKIFSDKNKLKNELLFMDFSNTILLFLSSGNFDGIDLKKLALDLSNKWN